MFEKKKEREEHKDIKFVRSKLKCKMLINNGNLYPIRREAHRFIIPEKFKFHLEETGTSFNDVYIIFSAGLMEYKYLVMRLGLLPQILEEDFSNPKNPF